MRKVTGSSALVSSLKMFTRETAKFANVVLPVGQSHQKRCHPERSAARAKVGRRGVEGSRECSKAFSQGRALFRYSTGFFTAHRPTAKAHTDAPFRMTSFFDPIAMHHAPPHTLVMLFWFVSGRVAVTLRAAHPKFSNE